MGYKCEQIRLVEMTKASCVALRIMETGPYLALLLAATIVNYQFVTITYIKKTLLLLIVFFSYCNTWLQLRL